MHSQLFNNLNIRFTISFGPFTRKIFPKISIDPGTPQTHGNPVFDAYWFHLAVAGLEPRTNPYSTLFSTPHKLSRRDVIVSALAFDHTRDSRTHKAGIKLNNLDQSNMTGAPRSCLSIILNQM